MDSTRHVIKRMLSSGFFTQAASNDVASTVLAVSLNAYRTLVS